MQVQLHSDIRNEMNLNWTNIHFPSKPNPFSHPIKPKRLPPNHPDYDKENKSQDIKKSDDETSSDTDIYNTDTPRVNEPARSHLYANRFPSAPADTEKAEAVKEAFLHGWNAYKSRCWGQDEYIAGSDSCTNHFRGGMTIIDSISTLYIMNLTEEYQKAREFVEKDFAPSGGWSLFEFIIRYVGGFISAYELTHDKLFLKRAVQCADAIYPLMEGGRFGGGVHITTTGDTIRASRGGSGGYSLADSSTYQLEFTTLSKLTGDPKYVNLAMSTYSSVWRQNPSAGLINEGGSSSGLHVGAGLDSYFEYIIKLYVMTRGVATQFLHKHMQIVRDIREKLLIRSGKNHYAALGVYHSAGDVEYMQEHLATFAAGMIAVGTVKGNPNAEEDLKLAGELATGYAMEYASTATGVGGERMDIMKNGDQDFRVSNSNYMLRPESVESVCVLWRFTGDPKFRKYAWDMFNAINKHARRSKGFSWIYDVNNPNSRYASGTQESFFFAETLKYLYLTFADTSLVSPAEWVFNTEGHPLRLFTVEESNKWAPFLKVKL